MRWLLTFTRRFRRHALWGLVLVLGLLAANEGCSYYNFGIARRDYPAYFPPETPLGLSLSFDERYGWYTALDVGDTKLHIEHASVATPAELRPLGLSPGHYLFTSTKVWGTALTSVQREYHYAGERLEAVGGYLHRPRRLATGELESPNPKWEDILIRTIPQQEPAPFNFVWIYKLPEQARMPWYLPQALWFDQPLVEHLVITQTQRGVTSTHEFTLENHWHKCGTVWWVMLHAT